MARAGINDLRLAAARPVMTNRRCLRFDQTQKSCTELVKNHQLGETAHNG
jgi:hypothetical protein